MLLQKEFDFGKSEQKKRLNKDKNPPIDQGEAVGSVEKPKRVLPRSGSVEKKGDFFPVEKVKQSPESPKSYQKAVQLREDYVWQEIGQVSLKNAVAAFLESLEGHTLRAYRGAFRMFFQKGLLDPEGSLQFFAVGNLEHLLDLIKERTAGSEATKQARAAAFVSFTAFLQRKTAGMIKKALPKKEKGARTFRRVREEAKSVALSREEMKLFLETLEGGHKTYHLIAQMILQGAKRLSEVLEAQIERVDWSSGYVTFQQKKTEVLEKTTVIHYPQRFLHELKNYLGERNEGLIFLTKNGKRYVPDQILRAFKRAAKKAGITKNISPHSLRVTAITLFIERGYGSDQVIKVSGHADSRIVKYYDKSGKIDNLTREICII